MKNGYFGHTKQEWSDIYEENVDTNAFYFEVKDNKIVNCVVGYDSFAYPDENKEESVKLKKELIGQDFSVIKERFGEEYTRRCSEETFKKAKEFDMKWFECSSEAQYNKLLKKTLSGDEKKSNQETNRIVNKVISNKKVNE